MKPLQNNGWEKIYCGYTGEMTASEVNEQIKYNLDMASKARVSMNGFELEVKRLKSISASIYCKHNNICEGNKYKITFVDYTDKTITEIYSVDKLDGDNIWCTKIGKNGNKLKTTNGFPVHYFKRQNEVN